MQYIVEPNREFTILPKPKHTGMPVSKLCRFLACLLCSLPYLLLSQSPETQALAHLRANLKDYQLAATDLTELKVTDQYTSADGNLTHVYIQQQYQGMDIFGAVASVHISRDPDTIFHRNQLINHLDQRVHTHSPNLSPVDAIQKAALHVALDISQALQPYGDPIGLNQSVRYTHGGISQEPIAVELAWQSDEAGNLFLVWSVRIYPHAGDHWWTIQVDATEGDIRGQYDWVHHDNWEAPHTSGILNKEWTESSSLNTTPYTPYPIPLISPIPLIPPISPTPILGEQYRVLPFPIESPNHGTRQLLSNPADPTASPYGWHDVDGIAGSDYTVSRGNNVDAYLDTGDNNNPVNGNADRADGGISLDFDFAFDDTQAPSTYQSASLTNLFYWNNVLHDVLYQYGFNEAAGNFQFNNYGKGGAGNDAVRAEAQDGGGTNDANFSVPPDGFPPRMQLYLWNQTTPERAGEMDNGIVIHEYAHGLSTRLIGGPSNSFCLLNGEQMGEGWSDWLGLLLTIQAGDTRTDSRALGTYALGQATNGPGNRPTPYSTDFLVNSFTYGDLPSQSAPYGVGYGWATILWEMTWDLIDAYGFDPDWYAGTGGNNIALQLVIDGLKLTSCNPGFVDARDAILQADALTYGGQYNCLLWQSFSRRGLGVHAEQGSSYDLTDGVESFELPPVCVKELQADLTVSPDSLIAAGDVLQASITVRNRTDDPLTQVVVSAPVPPNSTYVPASASHGGSESGGTISFPGISLPAGDSIERSFQLQINPSKFTSKVFEDDEESGTGKWATSIGSGSQTWAISTAFPNQGSNSWFAADVPSISDQYLDFAAPVVLTGTPWLQFWHAYQTESGLNTGYDGGVLEISTDNGSTWTDLGPQIRSNGYTRTISSDYSNPLAGRQAFAGNSSGYLRTDVDLSPYVGQSIRLRFRLGTDSSVGSNGWYIDQVRILDLVSVEVSTCVNTFEGDTDCDTLGSPGVIIEEAGTFPVEWAEFEARPERSHILLLWATSQEEANAGFSVERSLEPQFTLGQRLGWVDGRGTTNQGAAYKFLDREVMPGITYYYRLKQVDLDGRHNYSPIVSARLLDGSGIDFQLYPNPTSDQVNLSFFTRESSRVDISVYNALGQLLESRSVQPNQDRTILPMDVQYLAPGIYTVRVQQELVQEIQYMVIE